MHHGNIGLQEADFDSLRRELAVLEHALVQFGELLLDFSSSRDHGGERRNHFTVGSEIAGERMNIMPVPACLRVLNQLAYGLLVGRTRKDGAAGKQENRNTKVL